ncbi:odorant receptor 45a-like [Phlebotomus argentipes]|uniref:odorant receptor 45a-like n=1 Tax=Phlebotomus argentipes TaxID=94469 RepID=UPI0028936E9E|nr:odorant receptor 45a-like [Phlebotomus argentipes]
MLTEQHERLKRIIFIYYRIWRCEFIPDFGFDTIKRIRTAVYPVNLAFGMFCVVWHFAVQMTDYGYDLALTIVYFFAIYQCFMVYSEIMVIHRKKIFAMLEFFETWLKSCEPVIGDVRRKYLLINTKLGITWTRIFLIFITFVGISVNSFHLYISKYSAPMLFTIPGLPQESIFYYPVNVVYGTVLYFSILEYIMIADAVVMITILYFRSEFYTLAEFVTQLNDPNKASSVLRITHETHKIALQKVKELTKSFWHLYFHKLFAIMIYLCCTLYIFQSLSASIFIAVLIVGAMTSQIFILCFFGQVIENSSELLYKNFCMTNWYEMKLKDQKDFLMLLISIQKPVRIETFGFGNISIYTFVQICKAAGTYAAILYTVIN